MTALPAVAVVIPALNEAASIGRVLADLPPVGLVVVCDNGSTDGTAALARAAGATVVPAPRRGYGAACLAGLAYLAALPTPPEVVVFLDADYSDHPDELPLLARPVLDGAADLVIGSRVALAAPGALLPQARWGNRLACALMRLRWGARFTDLGPFRAIRYGALARLGMTDEAFGWTVEMQVRALRAGLRCAEVPVRYRRRVGVSKITGTVRGTVLAGATILATIGRFALRRTSRAALPVQNLTRPDLASGDFRAIRETRP
ncbi:MAG: glycosyltransferase family 2 protein [Rubricoccaceae bacterium]